MPLSPVRFSGIYNVTFTASDAKDPWAPANVAQKTLRTKVDKDTYAFSRAMQNTEAFTQDPVQKYAASLARQVQKADAPESVDKDLPTTLSLVEVGTKLIALSKEDKDDYAKYIQKEPAPNLLEDLEGSETHFEDFLKSVGKSQQDIKPLLFDVQA